MTGLLQSLDSDKRDTYTLRRSTRSEFEERVDSYRAGGVIYRRARPEDDADLRRILRDCVMSSWVTMSFEREPSYFSAENLLEESLTVIAREDNEQSVPVGMYSCTFFPVNVNGRHERVGYLGGLRVCQPYRNRLSVIKNGFASIRSLIPNQATVPIWFTSVASENAAARRLLEANLPSMPIYSPIGDLETFVIDVRQGKAHGLLQRATRRDVPALVEFFNRRASDFQFTPVLTEKTLLLLSGKAGLTLDDFWLLKDAQDVLGCLAIWDQRKIKQSVVRGYGFPLNVLRGAYNTCAMVTKHLRLPAPGERLEHAFLAFLAFDAATDGISMAAIQEGLVKVGNKGARAGILGLSPRNSLSHILKSNFRAHVYRSFIETVAWTEDARSLLDGRPPQPEVAQL